MTDTSTDHSAALSGGGNRGPANKLKLLVALIAGLAISFPVAAKLFKWVDDNGTTHYGETVPPEYAGKDREELNQSGRVVNSIEVMTPEKRAAMQEEAAKKREDARAALEQQRHDRTLINTYTSVQEIDLARHRSLQQVDARINFLNANIKAANERISALQTESDNLTKANQKIPDSLREDLQDAQDRLDKLNQDLKKPNDEKTALEARFDADKARYIKLTGKE